MMASESLVADVAESASGGLGVRSVKNETS
jgi:hypothetical protein